MWNSISIQFSIKIKYLKQYKRSFVCFKSIDSPRCVWGSRVFVDDELCSADKFVWWLVASRSTSLAPAQWCHCLKKALRGARRLCRWCRGRFRARCGRHSAFAQVENFDFRKNSLANRSKKLRNVMVAGRMIVEWLLVGVEVMSWVMNKDCVLLLLLWLIL